MTTAAEPPSTPDEADRPAPYAPYRRPQPFDEVSPGPVPDGPAAGGPVMHPSATTAMALGIASLGGIFLCGLPLLLAPLAWFIGGRTLRQIDADPLRFSGRERAYTGRVMGMTGTALLLLLVVVMFGADSDDSDGDGTDSSSYRFEL